MSDAELQDAVDLGLEWPDRLKRVKNEATGQWERVRMMEHIMPTTEAQLAILRSWSDRYADRRSLSISGKLDVATTLGVTVMGDKMRLPAPPQALQVIPPATVDAFNAEVSDAVFADIEEDEEMPELTAEPFEPDPSSPLTVEQQQVMARARSSNRLAADLATRAMNRKLRDVEALPGDEASGLLGDALLGADGDE